MPVCLSLDIEEHHRIEAAAGLTVGADVQSLYRTRMEDSTRRLLDSLAAHRVQSTFFVVGQIANENPKLIRDIHDRGHEVASHGWDHRRVATMSPAEFRNDLTQSKDALEQATGTEIVGYRAPTFSIGRQTPWAIDVLCEVGMKYDSSIYPIRHDRYGVPDAPRGPFLARGEQHSILELPPVTYRIAGTRVPMGGGGYFRLFPLCVTERAVRQTLNECEPSVAMLYFHPWEFDVDQPRLPLGRVSRFRTYVGIRRTRARLSQFMSGHKGRFQRAADIAEQLQSKLQDLPEFQLADTGDRPTRWRSAAPAAACSFDQD